MNIISRIKEKISDSYVKAKLNGQSFVSRVKSSNKPTIVHFEKTYSSEKILLLALYEKGKIRPDILNLLRVAKELDLYIIAVNTQKLVEPEKLQAIVDCYIERPNFGRDFGSYKTGFLHMFNKGWEVQAPRLLMLNDSLFYSKRNLKTFLHEMINTDSEVLGATENHEVEYHLGSFCISLHSKILQHKKFIKYWNNYVNSDVRPKVIKNGEMQLSKTLRRCVSSPDQVSARYNLAWLCECIDNDQAILSIVPSLYREPNSLVHWKSPSIKTAFNRLIDKYLEIDPVLTNKEAKIEVDKEQKISFFLADPDDLVKAVESSVRDPERGGLIDKVLQEVRNDLLDAFPSGSQIHQNCILLHYLGLPLIKLDLLYRGMITNEDVEKLVSQLDLDEKNHLRNQLFSRPFGGSTLVGSKRQAFLNGYI